MKVTKTISVFVFCLILLSIISVVYSVDSIMPNSLFKTTLRKPKLKVLDAKTRKPIANCCFVLGHWGTWKQTNKDGIFDKDENGFYSRLHSYEELCLWHPDYESKFFYRDETGRLPYRRGIDGTVTVLLEKSGTASLDAKVNLFVRGDKIDNEFYTVRIFRGEKGKGNEVRKDRKFLKDHICFSGLAAGKYVAQIYFNDAHPTHYESFELKDSDRKTLDINVKTDVLARIRLKGKILDKYRGKGIQGARVSFITSISDDVETSNDGSFSTISNRNCFHELVIYLNYARQIYVLAKMDNNISEELAQKLQFHIDPKVHHGNHIRLEDKNNDGIFCDNENCILCKNSKDKSISQNVTSEKNIICLALKAMR